MENIKRHILGTRAPNTTSSADSRSVFHINSEDALLQSMQDCYQGIEEFRCALKNLDGAGTHLTESLAQALRGTHYQQLGEQLAGGFREVYGSHQSMRSLEQLKEMESLLLALEARSTGGQQELRTVFPQTACHILLLFTKLQKQYFQMCQQKISGLIHHLLSAKDPEHPREIIKFIINLGLTEELSQDKTITSLPSSPWGSPKLRKASQGSLKTPNRSSGFKLFSIFERKLSPDEGKSAFYVSIPESCINEGQRSRGTELQMTAGSLGAMTTVDGTLLCSVPLLTMTDDKNNVSTPDVNIDKCPSNQLATEEELDCVIKLLSGISHSSSTPSQSAPPTPNSMHSITEAVSHDHSPSTTNSIYSGPDVLPSRSPMQLMVPNIYQTPSPVSDSHMDELQVPRLQTQVHRRSEGCLDLSGMGRTSTWPHQHQHHRASLPSMPLYNTHHQHHFDPTSNSLMLPHSNFFSQDFVTPSKPPPGFLGSNRGNGSGVANGGGAGGKGMFSSMQWSYGGGLEMRNSGTWPLYHSAGMPAGDLFGSSWSGLQDCSDGSDDSSNGDHFFAVGKDLMQTKDSKNESSDEETDGGRNKVCMNPFEWDKHGGSANTWSLQHPSTSNMHYHPTAISSSNLLEPPQPHQPLQMQWSDPLSSHSMWPSSNGGHPQQSIHGFEHFK